jgi:GlpG protein
MHLFGELADKKMAQKIVEKLSQKSIEAFYEEDFSSGLIRLYVRNEADRLQAFDTFRVQLGFAPELAPTPEEARLLAVKLGPWTRLFLLIGLMVGGSMLWLGNPAALSQLFIAESETQFLHEVRSGEVWRLFTPVFLHFGLIHLLFNLLCLKDFGSVVEKEHGPLRYLIFFLVVGVLSNVAQYWVMGPRFGGYSGVLFGLLGWLWVYPRVHTKAESFLPKSSVVMLLLWFFLCLFGVIPHVANSAHAAGLVLGMATGVVLGSLDRRGLNLRPVALYSALTLGFFLMSFALEYYRVDGVFYGTQF